MGRQDMNAPDNPFFNRPRLFAVVFILIFVILIIIAILFLSRRSQPPVPAPSTLTPSPTQKLKTTVPTTLPSSTPVARTVTPPAIITATPKGSPTAATGNVYYVSTDGDDSKAGTDSRPWRTISKGISMLRPGDTLYVRGGTYNEKVRISQSGTAESKRITVAAYPGETPVIDGGWNGSGSGDDSNWVFISGSYVTFDGFEVRNTPGNGAGIAGSYNILRNDNFHHMMNCGIIFSGSNHVMEYTKVWYASMDAMPGNENHTGTWCAGTTSLLGTHDVTIRHSQVYNSWGEGLDVLKGDRFIVEDNVIYDNWAINLYLDNATNTVVQRNLIYYTSNKTWWRRDTPGSGIAISDEAYSSGENHGHDRKIINNIVIGAGTNLRYFVGGAGSSALINDVIANNTLVEGVGSGLVIEAPTGSAHQNTVISNNIILQSSGVIVSIPDLAGITLTNNLWSRNPGGNYKSTGDVIGDPKLVAPTKPREAGSVIPDWYKLQASSPAIGKGIALTQTTSDFFLTARSSNPSMGAMEFTQ